MEATTDLTTASARRPDRRTSSDGQVFGTLLLVGGLGWLLVQTGVVSLSFETMLSVLLVTLGFAMVVTARRAGKAPLVFLGIVMTMVLAASSTNISFAGFDSLGDQTFRPTTIASATSGFDHGLGDLVVDLRDLPLEEWTGTRTVPIKLGAGDLLVRVPDGVALSFSGDVGAGDMMVFGDTIGDGAGVKRTYTDDGFETADRKLVLVVKLGFGSVRVVRDDRL